MKAKGTSMTIRRGETVIEVKLTEETAAQVFEVAGQAIKSSIADQKDKHGITPPSKQTLVQDLSEVKRAFQSISTKNL